MEMCERESNKISFISDTRSLIKSEVRPKVTLALGATLECCLRVFKSLSLSL